jgi:ABC-2 type transport system permease protein
MVYQKDINVKGGAIRRNAIIPLTYGRHALEMAVFYSSSDLLGRDILVLSASALVAVALGALAMRRGIAS